MSPADCSGTVSSTLSGAILTTVATFVPRVTKSPTLTFRSITMPPNGARTTVSPSDFRESARRALAPSSIRNCCCAPLRAARYWLLVASTCVRR